MLKITVLGTEHFNEETNEFFTVGDEVLELEHSLVSLSKWEEKYEVPFLGDQTKTPEQTLDYIRIMTQGEERPEEFYKRLTQANVKEISEYIDRKMTATWFAETTRPKGPRASEVITAELIYYWMTALQIPFECQHWHLKKLLTLIQVCMLKNQPAKKMPKREAMSQQAALNAARKAQFGTNG